jgi:DNA-binding response OmpR family regulator
VADRSCVLVVEDDDTVREVLRRYLTRDGHDVLEAADGIAGLELALTRSPDLLVLDLMLPGMDGLEVCRRLRQTSSVPIIMLTALGQVSDRVVGLEYGADDYVVKPFSPRELALRVGRVLDRSMGLVGPIPTPPVELSTADGELTADATSRIASCGGHEIFLTSREFDLLFFLLRHPGRVFGRAELMEKVWGWSFGDQSTVTVHVRRLREKIEIDPANPLRIVTVWGVGYRLEPGTAAAGGPPGSAAGRRTAAGPHGAQRSRASATLSDPETQP